MSGPPSAMCTVRCWTSHSPSRTSPSMAPKSGCGCGCGCGAGTRHRERAVLRAAQQQADRHHHVRSRPRRQPPDHRSLRSARPLRLARADRHARPVGAVTAYNRASMHAVGDRSAGRERYCERACGPDQPVMLPPSLPKLRANEQYRTAVRARHAAYGRRRTVTSGVMLLRCPVGGRPGPLQAAVLPLTRTWVS